MIEKIRIILRKTRRFQALIVVLAALCLPVFLVFNFSLNEHYGAFNKHSVVAQEVNVPIKCSELKNLYIEASDIKLELGMVNSITEPKITLSGKGHTDQTVKVDLSDNSCSIHLEGLHANPNELTLQILLPQSKLNNVEINGKNVNLHVERLRSDYIKTASKDGYGYFRDLKVKGFEASVLNTPLRLFENRAVQVNIKGSDKSVSLLENNLQQINVETNDGQIFVYDYNMDGQWKLNSGNGDITMLTKKLPYDMLLDLNTAKSAKVNMNFKERFWKRADIVEQTKSAYYGSVGRNPTKVIVCQSDNGKISIGKRTRYSELDPFKDEYPYANVNPYEIERSTKVK